MFRRSLVALTICIAALASLPAAAASAADDEGEASFDGETIVLDDGSWDGARACAVVADTVECFATEVEMNAWLRRSRRVRIGWQPDVPNDRPSPRWRRWP